MDKPIVVALSEGMRGEAQDVLAVSPRIRIAWVTRAGEPLDDVSEAEVIVRGAGLMSPAIRKLLPRMPRLRWLHAVGAGMDADLYPEMVNSDVVLSRTRGMHSLAVSEWVLLQLLAVSKRLPELVLQQTRHEYRKVDVPISLVGRTVGIVGFGEIGLAVAQRARGFGLRCIGIRRHPRPAPELDAVYGPDGLERLLGESDYVVLLTPLTPETQGLIGAAQLRAMRPTAWLLNVARGEIVDEEALVQALREGWIAGAALDVFVREPLPADSPLWDAPNLLLTPHNSGILQPTLEGPILTQFLDNLGRYVRGEPLHNVIDKAAGY